MPPSTASGRVTGSSTWTSLPSRVKRGCGLIWISMKASPGRRAAEAGLALALEAQGLAILRARRDRDVEGLAVGQRQPARDAVGRLEEIDFQRHRRHRRRGSRKPWRLAPRNRSAKRSSAKGLSSPSKRGSGHPRRPRHRSCSRSCCCRSAPEASISPRSKRALLCRVAQQVIGSRDFLEGLLEPSCCPG